MINVCNNCERPIMKKPDPLDDNKKKWFNPSTRFNCPGNAGGDHTPKLR